MSNEEIIITAISDIRELRDSENHVCPADQGEGECTCNDYDSVIDNLQKLVK